MVREAVFNILQGRLAEASVLDLFAGSGAMGIEALSRGAREAVFCDISKEAGAVVKQNLHTLGVEGQCIILQANWRQALEGLAASGRRFDLIFLDPPYTMDISELLLAIPGALAQGGLAVLEQGSGRAPDTPAGLALVKERRYGDTTIFLYGRRGDQP